MTATRIRPDTFVAVTGTLYAALVSNILLIVGCAPLVVGLLITDPARSWPLLAFVAPLGAPSIVGVFAVMGSWGATGVWSADASGPGTVLAVFVRAWRASWRRAMAVGALAMFALVVLGVDIAWAWGATIGAVAIPVLVTLMVLVVATTIHVLVVLAERPALPLRETLRACGYLSVRRWYLTAVSLAVIVLLIQVVAARPAVGLGLVASPLLYVVWAGSRYALRPVLDTPRSTVRTATSARRGPGDDEGEHV